jgi:hypothetical protein
MAVFVWTTGTIGAESKPGNTLPVNVVTNRTTEDQIGRAILWNMDTVPKTAADNFYFIVLANPHMNVVLHAGIELLLTPGFFSETVRPQRIHKKRYMAVFVWTTGTLQASVAVGDSATVYINNRTTEAQSGKAHLWNMSTSPKTVAGMRSPGLAPKRPFRRTMRGLACSHVFGLSEYI